MMNTTNGMQVQLDDFERDLEKLTDDQIKVLHRHCIQMFTRHSDLADFEFRKAKLCAAALAYGKKCSWKTGTVARAKSAGRKKS